MYVINPAKVRAASLAAIYIEHAMAVLEMDRSLADVDLE